MRIRIMILFLGYSMFLMNCSANQKQELPSVNQKQSESQEVEYDTVARTIHVLVALCDNKYQGIVSVPKAIGNGQDFDNNLYWGCGYGIRTFFKKSPEWKFLYSEKRDSGIVMERIVFKHVSKSYYLVADAYNGKNIRNCIHDFFNSCAGKTKDTLMIEKTAIGICGNSKLLAYIGHNGLMDFSLENIYQNADGKMRDAIMLACYSKKYFSPYLKTAGANPLVWTTHFMAPEAYTLHDALSGYVLGESGEQIRIRAAKAYNKYQKCGENATKNLLVTGF